MAYSNNENLFWELLELPDSVLVVDNDMCYIQHGYNEDTEEYESHETFGFHTRELVFLLAEKLEIEAESV